MFSALSPKLVLLVTFALLPNAAGYSLTSTSETAADCEPAGDHISLDKSEAAVSQCCDDVPPDLIPARAGSNCKTLISSQYPNGCIRLGDYIYYNEVTAGGTGQGNSGARAVCGRKAGAASVPQASVTKDPHATVDGGGKFDFHGRDGGHFALFVAQGIQVNAKTVDTTFKRRGGQLVEGSFFTRVYLKVHCLPGMSILIAVLAELLGFFQLHTTDDASGPYAPRSSIDMECLSAKVMSNPTSFVATAKGVEVSVRWSHLRMPLDTKGMPLPKEHPSHWYLDTGFRVLNATVPAIARHGLIGQSFDSSTLTVHGKRDNYGRGRKFKTSAQGEGAIEGNYLDYLVSAPFATAFRYSRYDATGPIAPRNVSALSGFKEPKSSGGVVGSAEDDVDE